MAEAVLFHHVLGRTAGVTAFADVLRGAGHTVHVPDLFDGRTFDDLTIGLAHAGTLGMQEIIDRAAAAADDLPDEIVHIGLSLGAAPSQMLAQTRPGARGAVLLHSCIAPDAFGPWPAGLPAQIHAMADDPYFVDDGDLAAARELASSHPEVELHLYPGDRHLFAELGTEYYDETATRRVHERVLAFLDRIG